MTFRTRFQLAFVALAVISIGAGPTAPACYPPLSRLARQAWLWSAYWRLRPLWAALRHSPPRTDHIAGRPAGSAPR